MIDKLNWKGKVFRVSGQSGEGCDGLCDEVMTYLEQLKETKDNADSATDDTKE